MATDTSISHLIINVMTKAQYASAIKDPDQLYMLTDDDGYEETSRKVTSISSSSTDTQYPSAKAVYTLVSGIPTGEQMRMNVTTSSNPSSLSLTSSTTDKVRTYRYVTISSRTSITLSKATGAQEGVEHYVLFVSTGNNDCAITPPSGAIASATSFTCKAHGALELSYIYANGKLIITGSTDLTTI